MGNWEMKSLGDVFLSICNGVSIKQGEKTGSGLPITRIETISDSTFNRMKMGYAGIENAEAYSNYILNNGDILMSHINSTKHLGKTAIYERLDDETIIHGMNLLRLQVNPKELQSKYAYYYFNSLNFKSQLPNITKDSVNQSSFTVTALKKLHIPIPPLPIQQKIADALDKASALIEMRKAQIEKLDLLIKSQFIEMFGDPVTNPKGWEIYKLSLIGTCGRGVSKHRPRNDPKLLGGKYPLIQTGDVANSDLFIDSYSSTYSEYGLAQSKLWTKGTLCITIAANIAKTAILGIDACFPDSVVGFLPNSRTNVFFVNAWFEFFQEILEKQAPESAQKNINLNILNDLNVICPPIELQNKFANFVENVYNRKKLLQESQNEMELNLNSLTQRCFSGEMFS